MLIEKFQQGRILPFINPNYLVMVVKELYNRGKDGQSAQITEAYGLPAPQTGIGAAGLVSGPQQLALFGEPAAALTKAKKAKQSLTEAQKIARAAAKAKKAEKAEKEAAAAQKAYGAWAANPDASKTVGFFTKRGFWSE